MKKNISIRAGEKEEISSTLYQRTEELYEIQNTSCESDGNFESSAILLQDIVIFPKMMSPVFITPGKNLIAIENAQTQQHTLIGLISKSGIENPDRSEDVLPIGIELAVGRLLKITEGNYSALIQGRRRVQITEIKQTEPFLVVNVKPIEEKKSADRLVKAQMRVTRNLFEQCVQLDRSLPDEANIFSMNIDEPGWLADMIATALSPDLDVRIELLQVAEPISRLKMVDSLLNDEIGMLKLEENIQGKVQKEVDRNQREFYLREQIKAIQGELGEGDIWEREISDYRDKVKALDLSKEAKDVITKEIERLTQTSSMSPEVSMMRNYIEWILELPWSKVTQDNLNIKHAQRILNTEHYGLKKAKDRVLEYLSVRGLTDNRTHQPILCFVGPPGTGKTSFGKSIAKALGRSFIRVSLGGVRDEAEIRGHRRTYIGALPGRILQTMKRAGTINPLFMLDEIDKLGADYRGDPSAALLEILDPEQNYAFSDHYLEIPYDLSKVIFITTANTIDNLPAALLDRMEIIEFPAYTEEEKEKIARKYLIPRQAYECGLENQIPNISDPVLNKIIREYTYEAGVRNLEREFNKLFRKVSRIKAENKQVPGEVTPEILEKLLGAPHYFPVEAEELDEIGVATAIAWTEGGGEIMPVEVLVMDGKGNLQVTGQIGDVMQESAQAALSYIKSKAREYKIDPEIFEKSDVHIHIPEGSIPKDGPSAGVTICTALVSAFTGRKVHKEIGMTGEITLRGRVLPVGGVKEKVLAARRAGIKKVLLPLKNLKDLAEINKANLREITVIPVTTMQEILKIVLI